MSRPQARPAADSTSLSQRYPGLIVAGAEAPQLPAALDAASVEAIAQRLGASGARVCVLSLGAPKQELFAARMAQRYPQIGFVCIGAALDFIAGEKARAPVVFQKTGMEWAWRLMSEPRRMFVRYARCAAVFADVALRGTRRAQEASR